MRPLGSSNAQVHTRWELPKDWAGQVRLTLHNSRGKRSIGWDAIADLDWHGYSLALGAGGATGAAFEAGVLFALATDHRVSLRDANAVVGTSAGAVGAALIGMGFDAADIAAVVVGVHEQLPPILRTHRVEFATSMPEQPSTLGFFRPLSFTTGLAVARNLIRGRVTAAVINALREGAVDDLPDRLHFLAGVAWPTHPTIHVCAVDSGSGSRVTFGPGTDATLLEAVAASCAVPAVFRPGVINGVPYVDGGIASPTNADLLHQHDSRLIAVISPMSGSPARTMMGRLTSIHARRQLNSEVERLRRHHDVLVVEPAGQLATLVIDDPLIDGLNRAVLATAYLGVSHRASVAS